MVPDTCDTSQDVTADGRRVRSGRAPGIALIASSLGRSLGCVDARLTRSTYA
ncbi:hypothetical protein [Egicoccus halophilus]|uniref:Uncharacterized protein n=1 Tax=Egicoccus halophilus TaxID=1670830 RepID=A0A8J3AB17_9ACTN|nr:hypothetical protein [Egicoccus halophilus]GGI06991.1 hypothetical protein GCM10011354_21860 [Egicoccus halophilus]